MGNSSIRGTTVSNLDNISYIKESDILLQSESDEYVSGRYNSRNIQVSSLVSFTYDCVMEMLGDMAFKEVSDYSPAIHLHIDKYNKLSDLQYCNIDGQKFIPNPESDLSIGQYFMDGILSTVYMPKNMAETRTYIITKDTVEPKIGFVKFNYAGQIDTNSGWVLANGQTYELANYVHKDELQKIYGIGGGQFRVPQLTEFPKINNESTNLKSQPDIIKQHVYTPDHSHNIDIVVSSNITICCEISCSGGTGSTGACHNGSKLSKSNPCKIGKTNKLNIEYIPVINKVEGLSIDWTSDQDSQQKTYPNHITVPVYVYIGEKI